MTSIEQEDAKKQLSEIVERFSTVLKDGKESKFSEADVSSKFILPFLEALGWDTKNIDQVKEQRSTLSGPVDYALLINRKPRLLLELKRFSEKLDGYREVRGRKETFPEQATRYAWHLKVEWVVLTNFKEIRLYNAYYRKPADGLRLRMNFTQFVNKIEQLWILSHPSVKAGELDKIEKKADRKNINEAILEDLLGIRSLLSEKISEENASLPIATVREAVQKIMDRLIVIRVAEDKDLIGFESLRKELESWKSRGLPTPFMRSLKSVFRDFDDVYNTKLFAPNECENLSIANETMESVINTLYQYNFDLISADVLGAIYEDYLGHVLEETTTGGVQIIESGKSRKEEGIFYTPTHLVEYVVKKTLGEILKKCKSPAEVSKLRILDPACGSGSFLIKAFDVIKEWYDNYNCRLTENEQDLATHFKKVTNIERKILAENLFGIDIDQQAAEIAAVNLMLKAMRRGEKMPLILGQNIKIGNSLINGEESGFNDLPEDAKEGLKPFKWESEFPDILKNGGFDVVIGNPPYFKVRKKNPIRISHHFETVKSGPVNAAMMFIDKAVALTKPNGKIGLVLPKMLSYTKGWKATRKIVLANSITSIVDCQEAFEGVLLEQILLIMDKKNPEESHAYKVGDARELDINISSTPISQKLASTEDFLFIEPSNLAYEIRLKVLDNSLLLGQDGVCNIILGLGIQSLGCWHETPEPGICVFSGVMMYKVGIFVILYSFHPLPISSNVTEIILLNYMSPT